MKNFLRNVLALIAGLVIGSLVNMAIVMVSGSIIPPPEGGDVTSMEGLKATMHLFAPKHFLFPFLAHALGTLVGAWVTVNIALNNVKLWAYLVGVLFLAGGLANVFLLPSPLWFNVVDLAGAYLPMSFLALKLAGSKNT